MCICTFTFSPLCFPGLKRVFFTALIAASSQPPPIPFASKVFHITANEIGSYKITDLLPSNFFRQISQK